MNFYGKYAHVRNAAWQVLIDQQITELPVKVSSIARSMGIRVMSYAKGHNALQVLKLWESARDKDGMAVYIFDKWYIFYDDAVEPEGRIRFTLAHELGHILLGHEMETQATELFRVQHSGNKPLIETRADMFAARLLVPACVLAALQIRTPEQIMELCGLSYTAAKVRADRMALLYERDKFGTHRLERQLMKQFEPFVKSYGKNIDI